IVRRSPPFRARARARRQHAVGLRDLQIGIADHRIVRRIALGLSDVVRPSDVAVHRVDGKPDDFRVASIEFGLELGHVAELGGAYRREVLGMRKQHGPGIVDPVVEANAAFGCISLEIWSRIINLKSHRVPPLPLSLRLTVSRSRPMTSPSATYPSP